MCVVDGFIFFSHPDPIDLGSTPKAVSFISDQLIRTTNEDLTRNSTSTSASAPGLTTEDSTSPRSITDDVETDPIGTLQSLAHSKAHSPRSLVQSDAMMTITHTRTACRDANDASAPISKEPPVTAAPLLETSLYRSTTELRRSRKVDLGSSVGSGSGSPGASIDDAVVPPSGASDSEVELEADTALASASSGLTPGTIIKGWVRKRRKPSGVRLLTDSTHR